MIKVLKKEKKDSFLYTCTGQDTLASIAQKFNLTSEQILQDNPLFSGVYEGCMLWLTGVGKTKVVVRPLETLYDIAQKNGVTVESIIKANKLKSTKVFVGMQLVIDDNIKGDKQN